MDFLLYSTCKLLYYCILIIYLYSEEVAETARSHEVASCLPNFRNSEKIMYKARSSVRPPLPLTRMEINLTESWTKTKNGENFLLVDEGNEESRMLVCEYSSL